MNHKEKGTFLIFLPIQLGDKYVASLIDKDDIIKQNREMRQRLERFF